MATNQAKATPARVLLLFTLTFAAVTAAAWKQHAAPVSPETVTYPTALGDVADCPVGTLSKNSTFLAQLRSSPTPVALGIHSAAGQTMPEDRMEKVGTATTSSAFFIYQFSPAATEDLWVKSAEQTFYHVARCP